MATTETKTDTKPGFRLPWSSDNRADDPSQAATPAGPEGEAGTEAAVAATAADATAEPSQTTEPETSSDAPTESGPTPVPEAPQDEMRETTATATSTRRPTKFLADLTNAMRTAAEAQRTELVGRFQADAKAFTELIHERSGTESANLRKQADDDIAGIREWSKAEIARIREETEQRISSRRGDLDEELESQAARIEREVERVKSIVDSYEVEMTGFFEELAGEEDPTRFAALAASLPEPPSLDEALATLAKAPAAKPTTPAPDAVAAGTPADQEPAETPTPDAPTAQTPTDPGSPLATTDDELPAAAAGPAPVVNADDVDPRVAALGLMPDFAAAEAEAMAIGDGTGAEVGDPIPAIDEDALAARLAGLTAAPEAGDEATTQLIVTGLVSVASIAGFKRHLARLSGVRTVGVASGPDGEFLFNVVHDGAVDLRDAIPTLPGFAARITSSGDGIVHVAAQDPETNT
jgi:ribosomal protein L12E/L44/L45/RPP1/RPP2